MKNDKAVLLFAGAGIAIILAMCELPPQVSSRLFVPLFILTIIIIVSRPSVDREAIRRNELANLAGKLKLQFKPDQDTKLADQYFLLKWLQHGDTRYAYNVLRGQSSGYPLLVFDYHFAVTTPGGRGTPSVQNYYSSFFIVEMKAHFPELTITRESFGSRLMETFIKPDIKFESLHFSKDFCVRSDDKKFAYDVCHPRMMEYLLANKDLTIQIENSTLAVMFETWLHPPDVEKNISRLIQLRKLMPDYIFA